MHSCLLQVGDVSEARARGIGIPLGLSSLTPGEWHTLKGTVDAGRTSQKASIPAKTWTAPHKRGTVHPANTCKLYLHGTDIEWGRLEIGRRQ